VSHFPSTGSVVGSVVGLSGLFGLFGFSGFPGLFGLFGVGAGSVVGSVVGLSGLFGLFGVQPSLSFGLCGAGVLSFITVAKDTFPQL